MRDSGIVSSQSRSYTPRHSSFKYPIFNRSQKTQWEQCMATLCFDQGTLLRESREQPGREDRITPRWFIWAERVGRWPVEGVRCRDIVLWLRRTKIQFCDCARQYDPKKLCLKPIAALQLFD